MYYAYICGVVDGHLQSLHAEQRAAIANFAEMHNLPISQWFEEEISFERQTLPVLDELIRTLIFPSDHTMVVCGHQGTPATCMNTADTAILVARGAEFNWSTKNL